MSVKQGDRVSLSLGPTINVGDYSSVKPMVTVTREIGDDPEQDLQEMRDSLKTLYQHQLKLEVMALMGTGSLLTSCESLDDVAAAILEGINNGSIQSSLDYADQEEDDQEEEHQEEGDDQEEVRTKARSKKRSKRTKKRSKASH